MTELVAYSERVVRAAIRRMPDGRYEADDALETTDGLLPIRATVEIDGDEVRIDFAGTAPQHDGNLNCPLAVTRSACFFVVRALTDPDVPASAGAFAPVTRHGARRVPRQRPAAGGGGGGEHGDVEPDHRRRARGVRRRRCPLPAQGQGTMNNVVLGDDRFAYYETIGGGQGACPDADGPVGRPRRHVERTQHAGRGARSARTRSAWSATRSGVGVGWRRRPPRR